jgi:hypothetical protein
MRCGNVFSCVCLFIPLKTLGDTYIQKTWSTPLPNLGLADQNCSIGSLNRNWPIGSCIYCAIKRFIGHCISCLYTVLPCSLLAVDVILKATVSCTLLMGYFMAPYGWVLRRWVMNWRGLQRSRGLIEVLSRHFPGWTDENHENPEAG